MTTNASKKNVQTALKNGYIWIDSPDVWNVSIHVKCTFTAEKTGLTSQKKNVNMCIFIQLEPRQLSALL